MKSRQRIPKRVLIAVLILSSLFVAYLHWGLFPGKLYDDAVKKIETLTHKKVSFERAVYLPFEGLTFHRFKVMEHDHTVLFAAERFSVNIKLIPFFREKKIIISNILVDSPVLDIFTDAQNPVLPPPAPIKTKISGQIDVPMVRDHEPIDLKKSIENGPDILLPENVYLEQIQIVHGLVQFRKNKYSPVIEMIPSLNLRMKFHRPPVLVIDGSLTLGRNSYADVALTGTWDLDTARYDFDLKLQSQRIPPWLLDYQKNHFLILKNGLVVLEARLRSIREDCVLFDTRAQLNDAEIALRHMNIQGNMEVRAKGLFDFYTKKFDRYIGTLSLLETSIDGLSTQIRRLDKLQGQISFRPDCLTVNTLRGEYENLPFDAEATIRNFSDPFVEGRIFTHLTIEKLLALLPAEQKKWTRDFVISGNCKTITSIHGPLKKTAEIHPEHKVLVEAASLKSLDQKINVRDLSCELALNNTALSISKAIFRLPDNRLYRLDASIPSQTGGTGEFKLQSSLLKLDADYTREADGALIHRAEFILPGLRAKAKGRLTGLEHPRLDLEGRGTLQIQDAVRGLPDIPGPLKTLNLKGSLGGVYLLKGDLAKPLDWNLSIDAKADTFYIHDLKLDNFDVQLRMKNREISLPYLHAHPYGGVLGGKIIFDCQNPDAAFNSQFYAHGLDLRKISHELGLSQDQNLSGEMTFQLRLKGLLKSPQSYTGQGALAISNGRLWQTSLFEQMGHLPFVKVEGLDSVVFSQMNTTFNVRNKRITTDDLSLQSQTVSLSLKGSVDFDQNLDFLMSIRYSGDVIRGAQDAGGLAPFMVQAAESSISHYKIGGTTKKPTFDKLPLVGTKA